ncbi:MAG: hypothetical protein ABW034_14330 [Steroidobacteraceae bacterium]
MGYLVRVLILIVAFAVAAAIPGLITGIYFGGRTYGVVATIIAAVNVVVLAVPAYIILASLKRVTFTTVCIASMLIGMLPVGWQLFPTGQHWMTTSIEGGGPEDVAAGISTAGIWLRYLWALCTAAFLGLTGGLGFWFVSRIGVRRQQPNAGSDAAVVSANA